ncbi:MAG: helix-turn-helix domain-containing protein [Aldersonia sp.]|nr:helix-turn-helix domain-containing protein [Aldersonia sp.]
MRVIGGLDHEACYRAVRSRDSRFDGVFFTAVRTTGIYCRPSCPAVPPKRSNVEFFRSAAAAHDHGYRACKRCRPDASPGSPEWDVRKDAVARAMRLVADGVVDREGVSGLANRLHYSTRHLNRIVSAELGAGPLAIARAQRAQTARILIETTDVPFTAISFAAGFGSVRQFNDTMRAIFDASPSQLRMKRRDRAADQPRNGSVTVDLAVREPYDLDEVLAFLAVRSIPSVEHVDVTGYRRSLGLPHGHGVAVVQPNGVVKSGRLHVRVALQLADWRDLAPAVSRIRRLLDLDADPTAVDNGLSADSAIAPLVAAHRGRRVPGSVDPFETTVRAIIGQQVSVAGARTIAGRIVAVAGEPLAVADGVLTRVFPTADALAAIDRTLLPMPVQRGRTLIELASRVALGKIPLDVGADLGELRTALLEVPGIGPWTADYVLMRGFGDPDAFLPTDLGVKQALDRLGLTVEDAERWRPWRAYALHHLWAAAASPALTTARSTAGATKGPS